MLHPLLRNARTAYVKKGKSILGLLNAAVGGPDNNEQVRRGLRTGATSARAATASTNALMRCLNRVQQR